MATATNSQEKYDLGKPGEYILRHGDAPRIHEAKSLTYSGRLDAPRQFLDKKRDAVDDDGKAYYLPQDATFVLDKEDNKVLLYLCEWNTPADFITGALLPDPNLEKFGINTEKRWNIKALWNFLKQMGYYFEDAEQHKKFLASLTNFNAKIQTAVESKQDSAGNKRELLERTVSENSLSNNPFLKLKIPIYKGYEPKTFTIELAFDATDANVSIFLVSDELHGLLLQERDALMEVEAEYFEAWGCSVLTKS